MKRRRAATTTTSPKVCARGGWRRLRYLRRHPATRRALRTTPTPLLHLQAGSKDVSKLDALFNAYRGKDSEDADVMGPEGGWWRSSGCRRQPPPALPAQPSRSLFYRLVMPLLTGPAGACPPARLPACCQVWRSCAPI